MPHDPKHRRKYHAIRQADRPGDLRWPTWGEPRLIEDDQHGPALLFVNPPFDPRQVRRVLAPGGAAVDGSDGWRWEPTSASARHLLTDLLSLIEPPGGGARLDDLDRFAIERGREIIRFTARYRGVGWCELHDRPWPCPRELLSRRGATEPPCGQMNPEPLRYLHQLGLEALGVVHVQAAFDLDREGESSDWAILAGSEPAEFHAGREAAKKRHGGQWQGAQLLAVHVQRMLDRAGIAPHIYPELVAGKVGLRVTPLASRTSPLLAAIAVQLLLVAIGVRSFAICSACGGWYEPDRAPAPGQSNYCSARGCQRKAAARRQARCSQRRKVKTGG